MSTQKITDDISAQSKVAVPVQIVKSNTGKQVSKLVSRESATQAVPQENVPVASTNVVMPVRKPEKVALTKDGAKGEGKENEDFIYEVKLDDDTLYKRMGPVPIPQAYYQYESKYEEPTSDPDTRLATVENADDYLKEAVKYANDAIERANKTKKLEDIHATATVMRQAAGRIRDLLNRSEIINNRSEKTRHSWIKALNQMLKQADIVEYQQSPAQRMHIERRKQKQQRPVANVQAIKQKSKPVRIAVKPNIATSQKMQRKKPGPPGGAPMLPRPRK